MKLVVVYACSHRFYFFFLIYFLLILSLKLVFLTNLTKKFAILMTSYYYRKNKTGKSDSPSLFLTNSTLNSLNFRGIERCLNFRAKNEEPSYVSLLSSFPSKMFDIFRWLKFTYSLQNRKIDLLWYISTLFNRCVNSPKLFLEKNPKS